jgi:hypothetical protein
LQSEQFKKELQIAADARYSHEDDGIEAAIVEIKLGMINVVELPHCNQ